MIGTVTPCCWPANRRPSVECAHRMLALGYRKRSERPRHRPAKLLAHQVALRQPDNEKAFGRQPADNARAPADELAALYHERWEIETALDELKTHLRGSQIVLRSKTPDLVRQEFYGLMMTHFAVRGLMHEAALLVEEDPDRLSFLHAVRVVRRKLPHFVAIPP